MGGQFFNNVCNEDFAVPLRSGLDVQQTYHRIQCLPVVVRTFFFRAQAWTLNISRPVQEGKMFLNLPFMILNYTFRAGNTNPFQVLLSRASSCPCPQTLSKLEKPIRDKHHNLLQTLVNCQQVCPVVQVPQWLGGLTLHFLYNLWMHQISQSICLWEAFPVKNTLAYGWGSAIDRALDGSTYPS